MMEDMEGRASVIPVASYNNVGRGRVDRAHGGRWMTHRNAGQAGGAETLAAASVDGTFRPVWLSRLVARLSWTRYSEDS
jgi:hypothetical protein